MAVTIRMVHAVDAASASIGLTPTRTAVLASLELTTT